MSGEEPDLVRAAARGDRAAFDRLAESYGPRLRRFVEMMGVLEAEDVVQDTLKEAVTSIASFRGRSEFSTWLLGIALNRTRRWWRAHAAVPDAVAPEKLDRADPAARDRSLSSGLVRKESAERVAIALDSLPPILREAFVLKHVEGLDYREIGELAGTSEGTARVRAHRAKLLLQSELGPAFETLLARARK